MVTVELHLGYLEVKFASREMIRDWGFGIGLWDWGLGLVTFEHLF